MYENNSHRLKQAEQRDLLGLKLNMENQKKIEFILNELIVNHNIFEIPKYFLKDYVVHTSKKDYRGHKIIEKWSKDLHNFFSDLKVLKIQFLLQTDEFIVWK